MNKTITIEGRSIHYRLTGSGNPVMLVHGFGEEADVWNEIVDSLKEKYLLIIPELPGSGHSEQVGDMSVEGMATVLHTILREENLSRCVLIGHSMGGYIALAFAEKYRDHLSGFGLFHSTAYADSEEKKAIRRKGIEFIREHGAFVFLKASTPNLFSPRTREENAGLVEKQIAGLTRFTTEALVAYYMAMINRPDRRDLLGQLAVPVLFIIGKHDNAVPPADSFRQSQLPEISYIHQLDKSGHMGMLEEPERCTEILEEFLRDTRETITDEKYS
ncbi:MAG: alpha/beta hydrolase [Sphingobacteriales bacterium]|nr:alpha/beta hydrolase [Sphingobacteriales bacterium]